MRRWRKRIPCPDCAAKGKPSTWFVPTHVNYPGWPVVPAYQNWCARCGGKGKVKA